MRFLTFPALEQCNAQLDTLDIGDLIFLCRFETYSCKKAGEDRKLFKQIIKRLNSNINERRQRGETCDTNIGSIGQPYVQKLFVSMILSLNASFPDYDFSSLTPNCFSSQPVSRVIDDLTQQVLKPAEYINPHITNATLAAITEAIDIPNCEAYSYSSQESPLSSGKLWSFVYFLFNPDLKRILLVACSAKSKLSSPAIVASSIRCGGLSSTEDEDSDFDTDSDYDCEWDDCDEELAIQAQWLSDDDLEMGDEDRDGQVDGGSGFDMDIPSFLPDSTPPS